MALCSISDSSGGGEHPQDSAILGKTLCGASLAPAWEGHQAAEAARGTTIPLSPSENNFPRLLGLATQRIPSSKGEQVCTPGRTSRQTHSAFMALPTPGPPGQTPSPSKAAKVGTLGNGKIFWHFDTRIPCNRTRSITRIFYFASFLHVKLKARSTRAIVVGNHINHMYGATTSYSKTANSEVSSIAKTGEAATLKGTSPFVQPFAAGWWVLCHSPTYPSLTANRHHCCVAYQRKPEQPLWLLSCNLPPFSVVMDFFCLCCLLSAGAS